MRVVGKPHDWLNYYEAENVWRRTSGHYRWARAVWSGGYGMAALHTKAKRARPDYDGHFSWSSLNGVLASPLAVRLLRPTVEP